MHADDGRICEGVEMTIVVSSMPHAWPLPIVARQQATTSRGPGEGGGGQFSRSFEDNRVPAVTSVRNFSRLYGGQIECGNVRGRLCSLRLENQAH